MDSSLITTSNIKNAEASTANEVIIAHNEVYNEVYSDVTESDHSHLGNNLITQTPSGFNPNTKQVDDKLWTNDGDRVTAEREEHLFPNIIRKVYIPAKDIYIQYNSKKLF